jgi:hypothetical protein
MRINSKLCQSPRALELQALQVENAGKTESDGLGSFTETQWETPGKPLSRTDN